MAKTIHIRRAVLERMREEARRGPEIECCGLLAGREGVISEILPATNALGSATEFEIAPQELFQIFRAMRAAGLEHLGIYHSHPAGPAEPSPRDVERAFYPEAAYFILSLGETAARPVRAFWIGDGSVTELDIEII